jgi:hypothetical protein
MEQVYFFSAVVGGAFLVVQTLLLVFGGMGHVDVDATDVADAAGLEHADAAQATFLKVLSLKTVVAFVTFFGLTGLAGGSAGWSQGATLAGAIAAGLAAVWLVAWLMASLHKLQATGNLNLHNAVGQQAKVYLRVPGHRTGQGRVMLTVQGRVVECKAVTSGDEIATGAPVLVVELEAADTLAVEPLEPSGSTP